MLVRTCHYIKVSKKIEGKIKPKLVKNSKVAANHNGDENTYFADKIKQNKEKILIGLAYLDRMYNFNIGNTNIKDIILDTPGYFGGTVDLLDWIISIGGSGGDTLKISNNKDAYIKLFRGKITNSNSIIDFLETSVNKLAPGTTMDGWFKNASKAFIVETPSKENPNATTTLYSKLKSDEKLQAHILPLLNLSENSIMEKYYQMNIF
ncbi:ZmpA/ZmpB/ZmpC family metallo-endopeptidase [Clostridium sp.]|uniref:ZmpA/ZmpB/ZmpC family metallo-endopeptidase n=2 Tax=Clostridium sp. TaxID=1506 RepID=UPI0027DC6013|nr:ZmpA/ZmpB/ZmpC family metallo-endopeptidase [uncultured Clostridium sp.]